LTDGSFGESVTQSLYYCRIIEKERDEKNGFIARQRMQLNMTKSRGVKATKYEKELGVFIRRKFLSNNKDIALDANDSFLEKGLIDSTGVLELVSFIEETYGITIEDEELIPDNLDSLHKLENFITRKLSHVGR